MNLSISIKKKFQKIFVIKFSEKKVLHHCKKTQKIFAVVLDVGRYMHKLLRFTIFDVN